MDLGRVSMGQVAGIVKEWLKLRGRRNISPAQNSKVYSSLFKLDTNASQACVHVIWITPSSMINNWENYFLLNSYLMSFDFKRNTKLSDQDQTKSVIKMKCIVKILLCLIPTHSASSDLR